MLDPALGAWRAALTGLWRDLIELEVAIDATPPGSPERLAAIATLDLAQRQLADRWTRHRHGV